MTSEIASANILSERIIVSHQSHDEDKNHVEIDDLVEIPLNQESLGYWLQTTLSGNNADTAKWVVSNWEEILDNIDIASFSKEDSATLTVHLLNHLSSPNIQQLWYSRHSEQHLLPTLEQSTYNLRRLIASRSEVLTRIEPFLHELMSQGALIRNVRKTDEICELELLQIIYGLEPSTLLVHPSPAKKRRSLEQARKMSLLDQIARTERKPKLAVLQSDELFEQIIAWFRTRLDLASVQRLARDQHLYNIAIRDEVRESIKRARRNINDGSRQMAYKDLSNALRLDPYHPTARRLLRKYGFESQLIERRTRWREVWSLTRSSLLIIIAFGLMLLPTTVRWAVEQWRAGDEGWPHFLYHELPSLWFFVLYGAALAVGIWKTLASPILSQTAVSLLLITLINSVLPYVDAEAWLRVASLSGRQLATVLIFLVAAAIAFAYIFIYRKLTRLLRNASESLMRTVTTLIIFSGNAFLYALMLSDLVARLLLYGVTPSVDAWQLANDVIGIGIPKLVIFPNIPIYGIHIFPSAVLVLALGSLAMSTFESGLRPLIAGAGERE